MFASTNDTDKIFFLQITTLYICVMFVLCVIVEPVVFGYSSACIFISIYQYVFFIYLEALDLLCDHLDTPAFKNSVGAKDRDINFLSEIMNNTVTQSVVRVSTI